MYVLYAHRYTSARACAQRSDDSLQELIPPYGGPGNSTQVLKISGKCLSLLSELTGPQVFVLATFFIYLFYIGFQVAKIDLAFLILRLCLLSGGIAGMHHHACFFWTYFIWCLQLLSVLSFHMALLTTDQLPSCAPAKQSCCFSRYFAKLHFCNKYSEIPVQRHQRRDKTLT